MMDTFNASVSLDPSVSHFQVVESLNLTNPYGQLFQSCNRGNVEKDNFFERQEIECATFYRGIPKLPYIQGPRTFYMQRKQRENRRGTISGDKFDVMVTIEKYRSFVAFATGIKLLTPTTGYITSKNPQKCNLNYFQLSTHNKQELNEV